MAKRKIEVIFLANTAMFMKNLGKMKAGIGKFTSGIKSIFSKLKWVAIPAFVGIGYAIKKAFDFEMYQNQFNILIGNVELAKKHFQEVTDLALRSPFDFESLIQGSKVLEVYGKTGKENIEWLERLGDVAAAVDFKSFEQIVYWTGRMMAELKSGQMGRGPLRLTQLAALSPGAKNQIEQMLAAGRSYDDILNLVIRDMGFAKGAMEGLAKTGWGSFSLLRDQATYALKTIGNEFLGLSRGSMDELREKLKELREDGTLSRWAARAAKAAETVKIAFRDLIFGTQEERAIVIKSMFDTTVSAFKIGAMTAGIVLVDIAPKVGYAIGMAFYDSLPPGLKKFILMGRAVNKAYSETMGFINPIYMVKKFGDKALDKYGMDITTKSGRDSYTRQMKRGIVDEGSSLASKLGDLFTPTMYSNEPFVIQPNGVSRLPQPEDDLMQSGGNSLLSSSDLFDIMYNTKRTVEQQQLEQLRIVNANLEAMRFSGDIQSEFDNYLKSGK